MKKLMNTNLRKMAAMALLFLSATAIYAQDADTEIKNARKLLDQDKRKSAVAALQKAITTYPEAAQLYYYLGHAQILNNDLAGAKASFEKGTTVDPKEPLNYVGLGHLLILKKNVAEAKVEFEKAIKLGKKNIASFNAIAEAYLTDKAYEKEAMPLLQRAKELKTDNNAELAHTYVLLGDAYRYEMNGGSAASSYEHASELNPTSGLPWFKLGELFVPSDITISEEKYLSAVKTDPNFAFAHRELGELYYKKKDGVKAAKHYETYLNLTDSPDKDDRFKFAFFLFSAKDYARANKEFEALSKKSDVSSKTLKYYAQSQLRAGDLSESQRVFELYMKHPDTKVDDDDYNAYAELLNKQGKDSLAIIALEKGIEINPNQPDVLKDLIDYYSKGKKNDQVERVCRIAIKTRKQPYAQDYLTLGKALYYQDKYVSADSAFAQLMELQPKYVPGFTWAARSKQEQDKELKDALAKPYYEKVIEIGEADKERSKNDLVSAYQYMGSYSLTKSDFKTGKEYFEKALELKPDDENSKKAVKTIEDLQRQAAAKPKKK